MTDAQKKMIYILLTSLSGPALAIVARMTHMTSDDMQLWLNLVAALTASAGAAWGITATSASGVVQQARNLPGVQSVQVDVSPTSEASPAVKALAVDPSVKGIDPVNGPTS